MSPRPSHPTMTVGAVLSPPSLSSSSTSSFSAPSTTSNDSCQHQQHRLRSHHSYRHQSNGLLWAVTALVAACSYAPLETEAVSLKSVQVWSEETTSGWADPKIYAASLEVDDDAGGARAPIQTWTHVGCFTATSLTKVGIGYTPLTCTSACDGLGHTAAAVQGKQCFCLPQGRADLAARASAESLCSTACHADYFSAITGRCGGPGGYYSVYQQYSFVHQTAQGCYDPRRFVWYQSVAVEVVEYDSSGAVSSYGMEWYLHASSINSGEPLFPYHQQLDDLHLALQYDLDSSRIVAVTVPTWGGKTSSESWAPSVITYAISTLNDDVKFTQNKIGWNFESSDVGTYQLSTGISAIDALYDVYFVAMPSIPQVPGFIDPRYYETKLYGINLNTNEDILGGQTLEHPVVLLEVNAQTHELFAVLREESTSETEDSKFYYVKLGYSYRSNTTTSSLAVLFEWTFATPVVNNVVNPYSYENFIAYVYQVGATAVDHVTNTSFVVVKESADADAPIYVKDINQKGTLRTEDFASITAPDVQATWLANTDPILPLTLAAPKLMSARFSMDGRSILVVFDAYTIEGALPIDSDGDMLPDGIDWTARQIGDRNCSDMFATTTAELLGDMPNTYCEWLSGTTIQIHLSSSNTAVQVGTGLFLKDMTIYAYFSEGSQWSNAASGGISVQVPSPLVAPTLVVSWNRNVDLCSAVTLNAMSSYNHGDYPLWNWYLAADVTCIGTILPDATTTENVKKLLASVSVGGYEDPVQGVATLEFGKDDLQPGCKYTIGLTLDGRWGLSSTQLLVVSKQSVPAPRITLLSSREVTSTRRASLALQTQMSGSSCEMVEATQSALKILWSGTVQSVSSFSGAVETTEIEDLTLVAEKINTGTLQIPKYSLEPEVTYTFTITVGYADTWNVEGATTQEDITVIVDRSPIKTNVLGGSRIVQKTNYMAIDTRSSLDPDFPDDLVEANSHWSFSYWCWNDDGEPCFPLSATVTNLTDVQECLLTGETFTELGTEYDVPSFSTEELRSSSYYCSHPDKVGVLIVNLPSAKALTVASGSSQNYTFVIVGSSYERTSATYMTVEVQGSETPLPTVNINKLSVAKVVTTQRLKVSGDLIASDKALYGDDVSWEWSFYRQETNPKYSYEEAEEAADEGTVYLIPETIFISAIELDTSSSTDFVLTSLTSNSIVIAADSLRASSTYMFRLTATTINPYVDDGSMLQGYSELEFVTAGPSPVPGTLTIEPASGALVDTQVTMTAADWTAEDAPLTYMFSYYSDPTDEYAQPMNLRIAAAGSSEQTAWCLRQGLEENDYTVQVVLQVYSLYGAVTEVTMDYKVEPPTDWTATNAAILEKAAAVDAETQPQILNCYQIGGSPASPPTVTLAPAPAATSTSTTTQWVSVDGATSTTFTTTTSTKTTTTTTTRSDEEEEELEAAADALVEQLQAAASTGATTASSLGSSLQAISNVASVGVVTDKMRTFVETLATSTVDLMDSVESDEDRDSLASQVFSTLGLMSFVTTQTADSSSTVKQQGRSAGGSRNENSLYLPANSALDSYTDFLNSLFISGSSSRRLSDLGSTRHKGRRAYVAKPAHRRTRPLRRLAEGQRMSATYQRIQQRKEKLNEQRQRKLDAFLTASALLKMPNEKMPNFAKHQWAAAKVSEEKGKAAPTFAASPFPAMPSKIPNATAHMRRLEDGDVLWNIPSESYPDWSLLPSAYRSAYYTVMEHYNQGYASASDLDATTLWQAMFDAQEGLETEWASYMSSRNTLESDIDVKESADDEIFANYTSHLSEEERETVLRGWWSEKARLETASQGALLKSSLQSKQLVTLTKNVGAALLRYMVNEEAKAYTYILGDIVLGRARDLSTADSTFTINGSAWKKGTTDDGSFGYQSLEFTYVNPFSWAPSTPDGPYLVTSLDIFDDDGTELKVEDQTTPLSVMQNYASFATAACVYWDWQENDGIGDWATTGLLNDEAGCTSTHLSVIGMFLEVTSSVVELPSADEISLGDIEVILNGFVALGIAGMVIANGVFHYWGFKQDASDRLKPMAMKYLSDGVDGPRSQDDPIHYSPSKGARVLLTYWNLACRDHILVSCGCRCQQLIVTRLQKASVFFAAIAGTAAVAAMLCGERVVDPKHYVEVGIISATLTYPMVGLLATLFVLRPVRDVASKDYSDCNDGPLEGIPVPDGDESDSLEGPTGSAISGPDPSALSASPASHTKGSPTAALSGPEAGAGPEAATSSSGGAAAAAQQSVLPGLPPPPPPKGGSPMDNSPAPPPLQPSGRSAHSHNSDQASGKAPPLPPPPPPGFQASNAQGSPQDDGFTGMLPALPRLPALPKPPPMLAGLLPGSSGPTGAPPQPPPGKSASPGGAPLSTAVGTPLPGIKAAGPAPPAPPPAGPRNFDEDALGIVPVSNGPSANNGHLQLAIPAAASQSPSQQADIIKKVRRMYVERTLEGADKVHYDERVDIKSTITHPMALLANALAHAATIVYWSVATVITVAYALYFSGSTAKNWAWACLSGWCFTWFVLEVVKVALTTINELAQLSQRKRLLNQDKIRDRVKLKTDMKRRQMDTLSKAMGPTMHSINSRPPLPIEPFPTPALPALPAPPIQEEVS